MLYNFWCRKCNKDISITCKQGDINNQICQCGELLKHMGRKCSIYIHGFPKGWSMFNNPDIAKPQTELQRKRQREFMENSIPISQSTI